MNTFRSLTLLAILASPLTASAQQPTPSDAAKLQTELQQRRDEIIAGILKGNLTAWETNTTDDALAVDAKGVVHDKASTRRILQEAKLQSFVIDDVKARLVGNCVVTTARNTVKGHFHGQQEDNGQFRVTTIMVHRDGKWLSAATQWTRIASP
jgi:hypothetical protein